MLYLLMQTILAARRHNDDNSGWMQILVFIVVGVLYALGGILKRRSNKIAESDFPDEQQEEPSVDEDFEERPVRPARDKQRRAYRRELKIPPELVKQIRPIFGKIDTRAIRTQEEEKKTVERVLKKPIRKSKLGLPKKEEIEKKVPPLLDIEQTDELKRAIVYSEILGKPVSLRKPKEQAAGF